MKCNKCAPSAQTYTFFVVEMIHEYEYWKKTAETEEFRGQSLQNDEILISSWNPRKQELHFPLGKSFYKTILLGRQTVRSFVNFDFVIKTVLNSLPEE